ncbi:MAG: hypothetical protein FD177_1351 [Desulfovibrionaceae bacterium]|nr:MAG: hypothetical protein FD177_1351 [Desulfovibrionaceae bacterium]
MDTIVQFSSALLQSGVGLVLITLSLRFLYSLNKDKIIEEVRRQNSESLALMKSELGVLQKKMDRFNVDQFGSYKESWEALIDLRNSCLGISCVDPRVAIRVFKKARTVSALLDKNAIFIDDDHYDRLVDVIKGFEKFALKGKVLSSLYSMKGIDEVIIANRDKLFEQMQLFQSQLDPLLEEVKIVFKKRLCQ